MIIKQINCSLFIKKRIYSKKCDYYQSIYFIISVTSQLIIKSQKMNKFQSANFYFFKMSLLILSAFNVNIAFGSLNKFKTGFLAGFLVFMGFPIILNTFANTKYHFTHNKTLHT